METEVNIALYTASLLLLAVYSGALTALEVLSLVGQERPSGGAEPERYTDRVLDDPVPHGIGLVIARAVAVGLVAWASVRLCLSPPGGVLVGATGGVALTGVFVAASLVVPVLLFEAVAARGAERFLSGARFLVAPSIYAMKPLGALVASLVRRTRPGALNMLFFRSIPLKEKFDAFRARDGEVVDEEQRIMSSIIEFGETRAREVMVPRIDVVAVNVTADKNEAIAVIMEAGHSRIPLYENSIDKILGTLYTKDLLQRIVSGDEFSLRDLARETFFVPESKMIDDLLTEFKLRKQHLAIVVDEYGGTAGIVTLEDVLEELVGDIQDEFDSEEELVRRVDGDVAVCNAKVRVDELNDELGLELSEDVAESLGGLLFHEIGRVPKVGDALEIDGVTFEIQSIDRQRIGRVRVSGLEDLEGKYEDRTG